MNGHQFEKPETLKDGEEMYYETVSKNRLILSSDEPFSHFKVMEFSIQQKKSIMVLKILL